MIYYTYLLLYVPKRGGGLEPESTLFDTPLSRLDEKLDINNLYTIKFFNPPNFNTKTSNRCAYDHFINILLYQVI